jgi:hypothetical protein
MIMPTVMFTAPTTSTGTADRTNWWLNAQPWITVITMPTEATVTTALANTAAASTTHVCGPTLVPGGFR